MMNVLYQFNELYAPFAGASIVSLFENNREQEITVYILGEELSNDSVDKFDEIRKTYNINIVIKDTKDIIEKMKSWGMPPYRGSYAANLRLFLPYFLDDSVSRVLYLDADTIVNNSIKMFYETPLEGKAVAMILDSLGNSYKENNLGFEKNDFYFNSGVILYDLNKWRELQYSQKIIDHVKAGNTHYTSPDQDLINVICKDEILKVSAKYNFQPVHMVYPINTYFKCYEQEGYYTVEELEEAKKDIVIYHSFRFVGEFPWNKGTIHPYRDLFDFYLKCTPWKEYIRKPANMSFFMKVEKVLYILLPKSFFLRVFVFFHQIYLNKSPEIKKAKV